MNGLPVAGPHYALLERLMKHANSQQFRRQLEIVDGLVAGHVVESAPTTPLKATDATKVRRALVADLRKGLEWDKKFKRGGAKMMKAEYANCSVELFEALFPHSAGKTKVALSLEHLQIESLGRPLRYGGTLEHVPGSLVAKLDEANGTISVTGKYEMM